MYIYSVLINLFQEELLWVHLLEGLRGQRVRAGVSRVMPLDALQGQPQGAAGNMSEPFIISIVAPSTSMMAV